MVKCGDIKRAPAEGRVSTAKPELPPRIQPQQTQLNSSAMGSSAPQSYFTGRYTNTPTQEDVDFFVKNLGKMTHNLHSVNRQEDNASR